MTKHEAAIISAVTGIGFGADHFPTFHLYAEEKFGHSIWTHEMADKEFWTKLKELSMNDFKTLANNLQDQE